MQASLGLLVFPLIAWLVGGRSTSIRPRTIFLGILSQLLMGFVLLRFPGVASAFSILNDAVQELEAATATSSQFMFGYLSGGPLPFAEVGGGSAFIVAFRVLPLILVISALSAVLHHIGVIPWMVTLLARMIQRLFRTSGPLAFGAAASVFFGIIEGPLLIRPYLRQLTRDELFAVLVCGMSTVAGTVMVLYASLIEPILPGALGLILVASLLSVPAALTISHAMIPGATAESPPTLLPPPQKQDANWVEALMRGTQEGTKMVIDIAATIVVLFTIVHLVNRGLSVIPTDTPITIQAIAGRVFQPLVWFTGIPWSESGVAGQLMGTKTVLNEFVAYMELSKLEPTTLSPPSRQILVTSMCGFANLGSMGILVGGLTSVIPERRAELAGLAGRAVIAGSLATLLTGSVVALVG